MTSEGWVTTGRLLPVLRGAVRGCAWLARGMQVVIDLGCGCGVLGIAATLLGAGHVVRIEP